MSALVTDQFRILNASNFVESFSDDKNSYYITVGLPNPTVVGYGRSNTWNTNPPHLSITWSIIHIQVMLLCLGDR